MLIITRKKEESIFIGDNIKITVVKIDDGSVKLAIEAPKDIVILREELYKEVQEENKSATLFDRSIFEKIKSNKK